MDGKVVWQGKRTFIGTAAMGYGVRMDTSPEFGGDGNGVSPMEMLALGTAGCSMMDVISIMEKKKQDVTGFEVLVHGDRATEHPKVYTAMTIEYIIKGKNIDPAAVERAVSLSEEKYCSAMAMMRKTAQIATKITIVQE